MDDRKQKGMTQELLNMIQENHWLMEHIEQQYEFNLVRMGVLQQIFFEMGKLEKTKMQDEIYQYGSMIKADDLLARQLFLWLLGMAESTGA